MITIVRSKEQLKRPLFKAKGKIIYFDTWAIVECPKDIMNYYWYWVLKVHHVKLNKPKFGSHISLIRGEDIESERKQKLWKKYHEQTVDFMYSHEIENNGDHYWLPIYSDFLERVRTELGLPKDPPYGFHLTLGRVLPSELE